MLPKITISGRCLVTYLRRKTNDMATTWDKHLWLYWIEVVESAWFPLNTQAHIKY